MVSLQKKTETEAVCAVEVEHLMTEEQAIAAMENNTPVEAKPETEVLELTPPLMKVLADYNKRLAKAEEEADHNLRCFEWVVFVIFALLFAFITIIGYMLPHEPDKITWVNIVQVVFGSAMLGTLMNNTMHALGIHLLERKEKTMAQINNAEIDEEKSREILLDLFRKSGLKFRETKPNEEGGFFTTDKHGNIRRLSRQEVFDIVFGGVSAPNTNKETKGETYGRRD